MIFEYMLKSVGIKQLPKQLEGVGMLYSDQLKIKLCRTVSYEVGGGGGKEKNQFCVNKFCLFLC